MPDQKALLVCELIVLGAVLQEAREKAKKLVTVTDEYSLYCERFIWIGYEDLGNCQHNSSLLNKKKLGGSRSDKN